MTWVKMDDQFFRNPKILRAGRDGRDLFLAGLCFCSSGLTDGHIPSEALRSLGAEALVDDIQSAAEQLVRVGLWEHENGGYLVHDYLEFNPSGAKVREEREAAKQRMQAARATRRPEQSEQCSANVRPNFNGSSPNPSRPVRGNGDIVTVPPSAHSARARDPEATPSRVAPTEDDEATSGQFSELRPGLKECPLCRQMFSGTYGDHLGSAPEHANIGQHRLRPGRPRRSAAERLTPIPPEVLMELNAVAQERASRHVELSPAELAEHERLLSLERSAREQPPPPSNGVTHTPAVPKPTRNRKKRQEA